MSKDKDPIATTKRSLEEIIVKILKRNKDLSVKLSSIENSKEYSSEEDPENIKKNINILSMDLSTASKASNELLSLINSKYPSAMSLEQYQKLKFAQLKSSKIIAQETELLNTIKEKYSKLSPSLRKSHFKEEDSSSGNEDEDTESAYMIPKSQILSLDHLVQSKKEQVDHIYKKTLLVNEISKEINSMTQIQEEKMEAIEENISHVESNAKETFKSALEVAQQDKRFKVNNCYLLLFLMALILAIMLIVVY